MQAEDRGRDRAVGRQEGWGEGLMVVETSSTNIVWPPGWKLKGSSRALKSSSGLIHVIYMFLVVRAGAWQQCWDQAWEEKTSAVPLPKLLFGKIHEGLLKYLQVRSPTNILKTSNKLQKSYSEKEIAIYNYYTFSVQARTIWSPRLATMLVVDLWLLPDT